VPHLASHVLGLITRRIRADWQAKYGHPVQALETFVDRSRFRGTCYRAAGWRRLGQTRGRTRNGATALPPEDTGWKDMVLVNGSETVRVLVKFEAYGGVFLQHCHNLEHEDDGMMQNFEVPSSPADTLADAGLRCERAGAQTEVSWVPVRPDLVLEATAQLGGGADWQPVAGTPVLAAGRYRMTVPSALPKQFFRLRHP
jgi:hypothetical protein